MNKMPLVRASLAIFALFSINTLAQAQPDKNGFAATEVVIGQCAPLSGNLAPTGKALAQGVEVAIRQANINNVLPGRKLRHAVHDDGYESARTVACTQALIADKAVGLVGYAGSGNVSEVLSQKILEQNRIALMAPYTGAKILREPHKPNIFHIRASYDEEAREMVKHILASGNNKRVAVFYQDDAFGKAGLDGVTRYMQEKGQTPVATGSYVKNTEDVAAAVQAIVKSDAQVVVMFAVTKTAGIFMKQVRQRKPGVVFYTPSFIDAYGLFKQVGDGVVRGMVVSQVVPNPLVKASPYKVVTEYQQAMQQFAPQEPLSHASFETYMGTRVLIDAIKRSPAPATSAGILKTLENTQLDLGGFKVEFDPDNHAQGKYVEITGVGAGGRILH